MIYFEYFKNECIELFNSFDKLFFSFEIGYHKPDIQIFEHVLSETKYFTDETIFIDDSIENLNTAQNMGIHTIPVENCNLEILSKLL